MMNGVFPGGTENEPRWATSLQFCAWAEAAAKRRNAAIIKNLFIFDEFDLFMD